MNHRLWLNLILACGLVMALGATPVTSSVIREEALTRATVGGEDVILENHTVPNVRAAFAALTHQGEWLGFHPGDAPYTEEVCTGVPVTDPCLWPHCPCGDPVGCIGVEATREQHFQGIARSTRTEWQGHTVAPVLYVARAGKPTSGMNPTEGALWIVDMGSRSHSGERLRSNRLLLDTETKDSVPPSTPPYEDRVIRWIEFDGDYEEGQLDYYHPGGIQMVGDLLAVALDNPNVPECDYRFRPEGCLPKERSPSSMFRLPISLST